MEKLSLNNLESIPNKRYEKDFLTPVLSSKKREDYSFDHKYTVNK